MTVTLIKPKEDAAQDAQDAPERPASSKRPERRRARYLRVAKAALQHDSVRTTGRLAVRHGAYVLGGTRVVGRRIWDGRTASRYERMIRAAEAAGLLEEVKEWEARGADFRAARHRRRVELLQFAIQAPKAIGAATAGGAGLLLLIGILLAWANHDITDVAAPFETVADLVRWVALIAGVIWGPGLALAPWLGLAAVWAIGQHQHTAPRWALPVSARDLGAAITPSIVVVAFRELGISPLRKAIDAMGDAGAALLSGIKIAGCGVEVDVHLPTGVSTEEIQNRRRKLAENLSRHEHEVFISIPPAARTVRLWIADSGALDEPVPASPLVTDPDMKANYKTGRCPWGVTLRGDTALVTVYQKMILVTGLSNQGKTASLRALALWLALDPTVEFRIGDLKGLGDWHMFEGLASILIEGPTDDHVMEVAHMVEDAFEEMQRRLLQPKGTVFDPLVIIVDEAQVAYGSGAVGLDKRPYGGQKATSRYFRAVKGIHDQGRAVDVTIWEGTQDPTDQNLPKRSREGNHIRASLVVGTEAQSKMALGDAPVAKGAAPHKLRQGLDKGQLVVAGEGLKMPPGQVSENVRTHFIDDDEAEVIVDRAKALRSGTTTVHKLEAVEAVDHLTDLSVVIGTEDRVKSTEVVHRLKARNHAVYEHWHGGTVRDLLDQYGESTGLLDGYPVVKRDSVQRALKTREEELAEAQ
ncbi:ATP-binding protein [Streptomyces sp. NPDC006640]|uniref:ATP-binding protein n=1 Tax=unclassified Streptomyces TaxID=2593676 RepID=UPI00368DA73F